MIIEDDCVIAQSLQTHLSTWGFDVSVANDFRDIMPHFLSWNPDLVLLDISLPFFNGHHWCREIRKHSKIPVVFLSSMSDQMNIVMAMSLGGDDFIAKPFDMNVLTAKVQAILRRAYEFEVASEILAHKGAILNLHDGSLSYQEKKLDLTKNEFRIMKLLMEHHSRIVSRETIMEHLWEHDSYVDDNTLTVNIARLRKRLEELGLSDFVHTKKGIGYWVD